jgi:AraC family transcriptional regulator of adaptative response/methylated-DNA-[protein]-cysteine methyltransferase
MTQQRTREFFNGADKDYQLMADALSYLGDHWQERPDYKMAAQKAGMSPHHFHKVFTRWAGLSPKRYVGALAHDAARQVLLDGGTIEDASYDVGLSTPSRLHDLFVRHEALSPGEAKSRAAGVKMTWGVSDCPFGKAVSLSSPRGLSAYAFCDHGGEVAAFEDLARRYPKANYTRDDRQAQDITAHIFSGGVVPVALYGTEFQLQVWKALLSVPSGSTVRYMDIANSINNPKAVRAVGAAIGANPISWVIPCHRILGADQRLTGYHWGVERKRAMLAFENMRAEQAA